MPTVTYTGTAEFQPHSNNPTKTLYRFLRGTPHEVSKEDAEWYAEEAKRGGPWAVNLGLRGAASRANISLFEKMMEKTKSELEELAREFGIEIKARMTKEEIAKAISRAKGGR
jgi:hypothetical protein